jgi:hypothetical protein
MKPIIKILLFVFIFTMLPVQIEAQQQDMFKQKKERKRLWRRWKRDREAYNPYLKKTAKKKESARISKGNKKELRKQKRAFRKELRRTRKRKGIKEPPKNTK